MLDRRGQTVQIGGTAIGRLAVYLSVSYRITLGIVLF